jgi:hypothetical protein
MVSGDHDNTQETNNGWFHEDDGLQTKAVLSANVKLIKENIEGYTTEGKSYQTLCKEAAGFSELNRSVQLLNKTICEANNLRKAALEKARTPSKKMTSEDKIVKQLAKMDPISRKSLLEKAKNLPLGS